jgi:hypothetical protein
MVAVSRDLAGAMAEKKDSTIFTHFLVQIFLVEKSLNISKFLEVLKKNSWEYGMEGVRTNQTYRQFSLLKKQSDLTSTLESLLPRR